MAVADIATMVALPATATWGRGGTIDTNPQAALVAAITTLREMPLERAVTDEAAVLTAGTGKLTFRMPYAFTVTAVRSSVKTASTSGLVTVDINEGGTSILSTKLSIDANEKTSVTAATPAVISDTALADDAEITIDIDAAGTGAVGLKVIIYGYRA
jgi:hypothetical protein